jgi:hypothetical protein
VTETAETACSCSSAAGRFSENALVESSAVSRGSLLSMSATKLAVRSTYSIARSIFCKKSNHRACFWEISLGEEMTERLVVCTSHGKLATKQILPIFLQEVDNS